MSFENLEMCFKEIENRYHTNEKTKKKLKTFNDTIYIKFLDTNRDLVIVVNGDESIEIKDKTADAAAPVKIEFTEEKVLLDLFNKELGAVKAYSSGKVKVIEGKIRNLLKLRSLLF